MTEFNTDCSFGNTSKRPGAADVARALNEKLEDIPGRLGQSPVKLSATEVRVGPGAHICIQRRNSAGKPRGLWNDFKAGVGGNDMLSYVAHFMGTSVASAMQWGISSCAVHCDTQYESSKTDVDDKRTGLVKMIRIASRIWTDSVPLAGTLGEWYFREFRKITSPIGSMVRFHPHLYHKDHDGKVSYLPAVVCGVQIEPGTHLTGVWRIYLSNDGDKANIEDPKKALGATFGHGGAVRLTQASGPHLYIAEGIENGLSALSMRPDIQIWCVMTVGGFKNVVVPPHIERVTILADNDPPGSPAYQTLVDGARALALRVPKVGIVRPKAGYKDLNAVLLGKEI